MVLRGMVVLLDSQEEDHRTVGRDLESESTLEAPCFDDHFSANEKVSAVKNGLRRLTGESEQVRDI